MIVATSQVHVFDVLDDDLRGQRSAAIENDELSAVPVDRFQSLEKLNGFARILHAANHLDQDVVDAWFDLLVELLQLEEIY
jgi:hypothetical protein